MDHDLVIRYVKELGLPVAMVFVLLYAALWTGKRLLESHISMVEDVKKSHAATSIAVEGIVDELRTQTVQIEKQTAILESPSSFFAQVCRAVEPDPKGRKHG